MSVKVVSFIAIFMYNPAARARCWGRFTGLRHVNSSDISFTHFVCIACDLPCIHALVSSDGYKVQNSALPAAQSSLKSCLPDLADKGWYMFRIFNFNINMPKTFASAAGCRVDFWTAQKVNCPAGQASPKTYLAGSKFACTGQAGRRLFPTLLVRLRYVSIFRAETCPTPSSRSSYAHVSTTGHSHT